MRSNRAGGTLFQLLSAGLGAVPMSRVSTCGRNCARDLVQTPGMRDGTFSVDCAHVRPLGAPHDGPDDVRNMLSLSPTMHRLFDRLCVRIDPTTFAVQLLHGNDHPHLPKLLVRPEHQLSSQQIKYRASLIVRP